MAYGLENPVVYSFIYGNPTTAAKSLTAREGFEHLLKLAERVAQAGRLRVSVCHAAQLIAAADEGVTLHLIAIPAKQRDPNLVSALREAVIAAITLPAASDRTSESISGAARVVTRAVASRAVLGEAPGVFSEAEANLLGEWLERSANAEC